MVATLVLAAGSLLGWAEGPDAPQPGPSVRAEYEAKKADAGRDPRAHVRLALWCEQNHLAAERARHLALAAVIDPRNALARGLMGLVAFEGAWRRPEAIGEALKTDAALGAKLAEYNRRRDGVRNSAEAHWKLALWCAEQGLEPEARAHLTTVVRLDPSREAAWKKLGLKKAGRRWVGDAQLAAEKAEADAQKVANKHWRPLVRKWHSDYTGKIKSRREEAGAALDRIGDPRAVPALWECFARGDEPSQAKLVAVLGAIEGVEASRALAALAVFSRSGEVRRAAIETLGRRDTREVIGWLIALIRKPLRYEVRHPGGPGAPPQLHVAGEDFDTLRDYTPRESEFLGYDPSRGFLPGQEGWNVGMSDAEGNPLFGFGRGIVDFGPGPAFSAHLLSALANLPGQGPNHNAPPAQAAGAAARNLHAGTTAQAPSGVVDYGPLIVPKSPQQLAAAAARAVRRRLESDIQAIESMNAATDRANTLVLGALAPLTGQEFPPDPATWKSWWADQQGYVYKATAETAKPTIVENVGPGALQVFTYYHSCFRAGTPVRTLNGPRAIDSIAVGDRVLVQDTASGEVRFEPVLAVYHNKPATLYRVDLGTESIWATGIHRFWKAGRGWVMARDLKPGDGVRTLGGIRAVESIERGPVEPVFNLEVGGGQSFFVGAVGALVHDNSLVEPVTTPFDSATASPAARSSRE